MRRYARTDERLQLGEKSRGAIRYVCPSGTFGSPAWNAQQEPVLVPIPIPGVKRRYFIPSGSPAEEDEDEAFLVLRARTLILGLSSRTRRRHLEEKATCLLDSEDERHAPSEITEKGFGDFRLRKLVTKRVVGAAGSEVPFSIRSSRICNFLRLFSTSRRSTKRYRRHGWYMNNEKEIHCEFSVQFFAA